MNNVISTRISPKMSQEDMLKFNRKFNTTITLEGATYYENSPENHFEYSFWNSKTSNYKKNIQNWLEKHKIPYSTIFISPNIHFFTSKQIPDELISKFEKELDVKFIKYEIKCNSDEIEYYFDLI